MEAEKASLQMLLKDADTLVNGDSVLATWRQSKASKRFDADRFKLEHPDLWAAYQREVVGARRFLLKGASDE